MTNNNLTGPFGIWTFPILKTVISFVNKIKDRTTKSSNINKSTTTLPETPPVIINTETWSWMDYKGVKQEITVHRQKRIKG